MERELKLELQEDQLDRLRDLPVLSSLRVGQPHDELHVNTYFDTADFELYRRQLSLRVSRNGDRLVQTLKTQGRRRAGLFEREEYESAIAGETPELDALLDMVPKQSDGARLIGDAGLASRLKPVFATHVRRTVSQLRLPHGEEVELALDRGELLAGHVRMPIREVEMEIKNGESDRLYAIAMEMLAAVPLRISRLSKGERGYALIAGEEPEAVHAQAVKLGKCDSVGDAFHCIAQNCLAQVYGNERGVVANGPNAAACVHQMRVGLRRLRSALDIFEPRIVCPDALQQEIKWVAGELGAARDWEVLVHATLAEALADAPENIHADALRNTARERADENRRRAAQAVDSVRYTRLVIELNHWLDNVGKEAGLKPETGELLGASALKFARKTLRARHRKLMKRGCRLPMLDVQRRHRARIAAKKLRYAIEFFASLYSRQRLRPYRAVLSSLQDDLGWRNDVAVADGLLAALQAERPKTAIGAGFVRGYLIARVAADQKALRRLWKRFRRTSPPA